MSRITQTCFLFFILACLVSHLYFIAFTFQHGDMITELYNECVKYIDISKVWLKIGLSFLVIDISIYFYKLK